jgi:hypothetical protein
MLCRVALVRTDVSEELSASFIRVTRIGELGTTLAITSNWRTLQRNIPEDTILHSHHRENLKSYRKYIVWILARTNYETSKTDSGRYSSSSFYLNQHFRDLTVSILGWKPIQFGQIDRTRLCLHALHLYGPQHYILLLLVQQESGNNINVLSTWKFVVECYNVTHCKKLKCLPHRSASIIIKMFCIEQKNITFSAYYTYGYYS